MITLSDSKETKARKEHQCNFCGGKIVKGLKYINSTHIYDGLYHWKSHIYCNKLVHDLNMYRECNDDGVTQDFFIESVSEKYIEIMLDILHAIDLPIRISITEQLNYVPFIKKLWFVIRYLKS
jgi:hypothetical protein